MLNSLNQFKEPNYQPNRLISLAKQQKNSNISLDIEILKQKINNHQINIITPVEFIWLIGNDQPWQNINSEEALELATEIWNISLEIEWLHHSLIRRLIWVYDGQKNIIASCFIHSFKSWSKLSHVKKNLLIKIVAVFYDHNPQRLLAKITCSENLTRRELFDKFNLILSNVSIFQNYIIEIAPYFSRLNPITDHNIDWLLRCFDEMEESIQITSVDYLLCHLSIEIAGKFPKLVNWLKQHYKNSPKQQNLSSQAKEKLRDLIGVINYNDFRDLVNLIITKIEMEKDRSQLQSRQGFWANYSNNFERLKILLPNESYQLLSSSLREDQDFQRLEFDGSDPTEICIFDLGEKGFIVEFFRGRGSETRFFPKNDNIEQVLFNSQSLSIKQIRALGGEAHDHVMLWQWACERWLREKHRILPNKGTQYFIGLKKEYGKYDFNYGMSEPSEEDKNERQKQLLQNWNYTIKKLKNDAKIYTNKIYININNQNYFFS